MESKFELVLCLLEILCGSTRDRCWTMWFRERKQMIWWALSLTEGIKNKSIDSKIALLGIFTIFTKGISLLLSPKIKDKSRLLFSTPVSVKILKWSRWITSLNQSNLSNFWPKKSRKNCNLNVFWRVWVLFRKWRSWTAKRVSWQSRTFSDSV